MTDLEGLIRFWEAILLNSRWIMEPSIQVHIETTIKLLKKLQEIQGGQK